jgi:hypothetical protein
MMTREEDLIEEIRQAFAGVRLEDGDSLNMTEYYDYNGYLPEYKERAAFDERDDWQAIPDKTLEQFGSTFSFTDLKGYRFYLPAYMTSIVREYQRVIQDLGPSYRKCETFTPFNALTTISAIDPENYQFKTIPFLVWFTSEQVSAMVHFLEYIDDDHANEKLAKIKQAKKAES